MLIPRLYETHEIIVINKPPGLPFHSGEGVRNNVVDQLKKELALETLYPIHRLDRETSGVNAIALSHIAASHFAKLMEDSVKDYILICKGRFRKNHFFVDTPIAEASHKPGGKPYMHVAKTEFKVTKGFGDYSLLEARLHTGRRHQIRIHLASLDRPVLGDDKYGDFPLNKEIKKKVKGQFLFLHAKKLIIPARPKIEITAPWPDYFDAFLKIYNIKI